LKYQVTYSSLYPERMKIEIYYTLINDFQSFTVLSLAVTTFAKKLHIHVHVSNVFRLYLVY